jgi:hypothetical protein
MSNQPILSLALVLAPVLCVAGGTVGLNEIDPLLREKPAIRAFLLSSLNLDDTVMAAVRFGPHFEHLGGARMGPYLLQGRPKGPKDGTPLEIVLCTDRSLSMRMRQWVSEFSVDPPC